MPHLLCDARGADGLGEYTEPTVQRQVAYQVELHSASGELIFDSGRLGSSRSLDVPLAPEGATLRV